MTGDGNTARFQFGDAAYQAAGGAEGLARLAARFYQLMDSLPEAQTLRQLHGDDLSLAAEKLEAFLSGWLGGPNIYVETFGQKSLPMAHRHLPVDHATKDAWLRCMSQALDELDYPRNFRDYLMARLAIPAEAMRLMSEVKQSGGTSGDNFYELK